MVIAEAIELTHLQSDDSHFSVTAKAPSLPLVDGGLMIVVVVLQ